MARMAHPPDRALTRAIAQVLREARDRGKTQKDIADFFGVSDATISRWEAGGRQPALDLLPTFDRFAGHPRGHVLRLAGYVDDELDLPAMISVASELHPEQRQTLLDVYAHLRKRSAPSATVPDMSAKRPAKRSSRASR